MPRKLVAAAKEGDRIYMISSHLHAGEMLAERNVLEEVVSAVDRRFGNFVGHQTTLPANPGCHGAPVFNTDGMLIGIMAGALGELERTSLVVPVAEVLRAIDSARLR